MIKIQSMPLNVVCNLARNEIVSACLTNEVTVIGVGYAYKHSSDEENEYPLLVTAETFNCYFDKDNGTHPWLLVWNEEECEFNSIMRLDQQIKEQKEQ